MNLFRNNITAAPPPTPPLLKADSIESRFTSLFNTYKHTVYLVALRYLKSETEAQEVVQEAFLKLWSQRNNIKSGTPVDAWLYTVAKNITLNRLKRIATEQKAANYFKNFGDDINHNPVADTFQNAANQQMFTRAVNALSHNQRMVFQLAREENLSYVEIAERLNISPLTVKTHMARALKQLKTLLAPGLEN